MKRQVPLLLIVIILILGFGVSILVSMRSLQDMGDKNDETFATVLAGSVYDVINTRLTDPIAVGQTMSHDAFLLSVLTNDEIDETEREAFEMCGKVYRIGGDEFATIAFTDKEIFEARMEIFKEKTAAWRGELVDELSVSIGVVVAAEHEETNFKGINNLADSIMYKQKAHYYDVKGINRRR